MLRKLLLGVCLMGATHLMAQVGITPIPTEESKTDYKLMGAPMPPFVVMTFHDTSAKAAATAPAEESTKHKKRKHHEEAEAHIQKSYITSADLDNGANLMVMMFNPTCSHCMDETQTLEKNMDLFRRTKLVLIANKMMVSYLPDFVKQLHTDNYPFMYTGTDTAGFIDKVFLYSALPQINIYDSRRKLIRTFTGDVVIDSLKKYIE